MTIDLDRLAASVRARVPGVKQRQGYGGMWLIYDSETAYVSMVLSPDGTMDYRQTLCDPIGRLMLRAVLDALDDQEREAHP